MTVIDDLIETLGADVVLTGEAIGGRYRSDASGTGKSLPLAVLRPASTQQVSAALAICDRHRQPIVPQGGLTGLAGGANARGGDIAISLERMSGVEDIDTAAGTMTVLAGTPLEVAQLVARGLTNREIAAELVLSSCTIDSHVQHILTKLDFNSRSQIAGWVVSRR